MSRAKKAQKEPPIERPVTIPERFWNSLSESGRESVAFAEKALGIIWPTGSQVICPDHTTSQSDFDIFGFRNGDALLLAKIHYGGWLNTSGQYQSGTYSYRKGEVNLILFSNKKQMESFKLATDYCVGIGGPSDKLSRLEVFNRIVNPGLIF